MENNDYRNITLSTKVCARQKAEYVKIAAQNGISMSEWLACIIESNKNKYGKEGDPTKRELTLEKEIDTVKKQNVRLAKDRESADYRVSLDMKRACRFSSKNYHNFLAKTKEIFPLKTYYIILLELE